MAGGVGGYNTANVLSGFYHNLNKFTKKGYSETTDIMKTYLKKKFKVKKSIELKYLVNQNNSLKKLSLRKNVEKNEKCNLEIK